MITVTDYTGWAALLGMICHVGKELYISVNEQRSSLENANKG